ncbi:ankyrin repeat domain-containing protein [Ornithinibacillus scapharcae]|uniref:ankyrin repeat domain-containing protein n=1 Tax=Ornithinibacillus scapharcae TaxID=1147159 RepID=UPI000225C0D1|nr:ankyrin repeat domain-containing protein [Ornithinibacillus scapharcae]
MKRPNHLESLDEQLRMMPKPDITKHRALQIKQTILNTRVTQATRKKKRNFRAISSTIGALAAILIFAVLVIGNAGQEQTQATLPLLDLVEGDIVKIDGAINEEHYSTEESPMITLFMETVGSMELTESNVKSLNGLEEKVELYDKDGELLQVLQFNSNSELVSIDGILYEVESSKWLEFKEKFFTDEYLLSQEDGEGKSEDDNGEEISVLFDDELAKAPSERNWDKIIDFVQQGANPDRALLIAAKENLESIVLKLLQLNANPNVTNNQLDTPLTITTNTKVASLLLENGADINHRNARDYNALVIAVYGHQSEMVKILLEAGANPNTTVTSNSDVSVLWMAGKVGNKTISDLLLQHGATPKEGYELENWLVSQKPSLSEMLVPESGLLSLSDIGRLPKLPAIQVPADSTSFPAQFEEPFESYKLEGGTADVYGDHIFIKNDDENMYSAYRYELNPGDNVTVADIENALGAPSSLNDAESMSIMSYNLKHYELRFIYDGTVSYPKNETDIIAMELHYKKPGIKEHADTVFSILAEHNMEELSSHVHPEKGVLIAPFLQVKPNDMSENHEPLIFHTEEIPSLLQDTTVYRWGDHGSSGLPIELTPAGFFDEYLYTKAQPDTFYVNQQNLSGPEFFTETIRDVFPVAHMVQYSFYETVKGDDLSWMQLTLIFEEYQGEWKLVGMLHREWTP